LEIDVGRPTDVLGHSITTTEVLHYSGAPSTAIVLSDGQKRFAYSGDTEWVEALVSVADGADLFVTECYGYAGELTGHVTWQILQQRLPDLRARRIMVTHMNPTMLTAPRRGARRRLPRGRGWRDRYLSCRSVYGPIARSG
jgi:ribonuclease BN (tRNA processing enzyme)